MIDFQYFIDYFKEFPFVVQVAWALSGGLLLLIILLTLYLKLVRSYLRRREIQFLLIKDECEALVVEYLYSGDENEGFSEIQKSIILKLTAFSKVKYKRKIIISILYDLMNEVSGEMSDSIKKLYFETGLVQYALARLKSSSWYVIAKGIGELNRFNVDEAKKDVSNFISHPKREVRKETQLYLVNLFRFVGLSFLDELKTPMSEWDQVQLLEILHKFDDQQISDIKPWLKSSNDTVVLFALKLAQIYNQFGVNGELIELLAHNTKEVRIKAIEVLSNLYGIEAKEILKTNFNDLSLEEQIAFFEMLENLAEPSDESFVEKHIFNKEFELQLMALKILKDLNPNKFKGLNNFSENNTNPELSSNELSMGMLKFVKNN